jgi:hypothetical protein
MPDPFDLDALELDDQTEPFRFTFGGESFEISAHYDPRAFRRLTTGDLGGGLLQLLGEEQYERLDAIDKPFDERHLKALLEKWAEHFGTTVGEAQASSSSSNGTGRPSKPTSNASTESASPTSPPAA